MDTIRTADGRTVKQGDRVYNYYDGYWCTVGKIDNEGWFDAIREDGSRGAVLNGERISTYKPTYNR